MDILEFAANLPGSGYVPTVIDGARGVGNKIAMPAGFVPRRIAEANPKEAPVLLIAAPAAVGKSTCARALAAEAHCLFVDLAGRQVGDGSFVGILLEALREEDAIRTLGAIRENRASIVIDALDETHLKSGDLNFLAFIQGICRFARTSSGNGNIVLLSRIDAASWISETFSEEGVPLREAAIEYFDREQAETFIDVANFVRARDNLIGRVAEALYIGGPDYWSEPDGRRFLGYAPVLQTLSSYLCVPNHDILARAIENEDPISGTSQVREWAALRSLSESLLRREQDKFLENFWSAEMGSKHPGVSASILYTPFEQCLRLLSRVETGEDRSDLPAHITPDLRAEYQQKVKEFLGNHPFLESDGSYVNGVFRDYIYALVLVATDPGERAAMHVVRELRSRRQLPSPVLGPMIVELLASHDDSTFDSDRIDLLMESLQAQEERGLHYSFSVLSDSDGAQIDIVRRNVIKDAQDTALELRLHKSIQGMQLPARCKDLVVDYDGDVSIGERNKALRFGPGVSLRSDTLELQGGELVVDAQDEARPVTIEADLVISDYSLNVQVFGNAFSLLSDEVDGPLRGYAKRREEVVPDEGLREGFRALRRMLHYFRRTVHDSPGALSAPQGPIDRFLIRPNPIARSLMDHLIRGGVARAIGDNYILDLNELSRMGVNQVDVKNLKFSEGVRQFLIDAIS